MNKKRVTAAFAGCVALAGLLVICTGAYFAKEKYEQQMVSFRDEYQNQGLEEVAEPDQIPDEITDEEVIFSDRSLQRCLWTEEDAERTVDGLNNFFKELKKRKPSVRAYVSVIPLRIGFEEAPGGDHTYSALVREERDKLDALEKSILDGIQKDAVPVRVNEILNQHRDESIFYRNENVWTSRGAYYGMQEFLESAGLERFPLDSFWEYDPIMTAFDTFYYYLYEGYNPLMTVVDSDQTETRKVPMISLLRGGTGAFLGGSQEYSVLDGLADNGRNLLLLNNYQGSVEVPWLVTQFEKILYMNSIFYYPEKNSFWDIINEFDITDIYIVISAADGGGVSRLQIAELTERILEAG